VQLLRVPQFPITSSWLGFRDVEVTVTDGRVEFRRLTPRAADITQIAWPVYGRWTLRSNVVVVGVEAWVVGRHVAPEA